MANTTVDLSNLQVLTNDVYYPLYWDQSRFLTLMGGSGSGKSRFIASKVIVRCLKEPKLRFCCFRKVAATLRASVFQEIIDAINLWNLEGLFKINKSDMEIECRSGAKILFKGLDDVEKMKSIAGINSMWIEEATELDEGDFDQLNLRMRGKTDCYKQTLISFNPISVYHWLKKRFFDVPVTGEYGINGRIKKRDLHLRIDNQVLSLSACTLITTYKDNKWMQPEDKAAIEALIYTNPDMYRIYAEGEWGEIGGLIFEPPPKIIADLHYPAPKDADDIIYGMDFGYNNPTTLTEIIFKSGYIFVREVIFQPKLTISDICERLPLLIRTKSIYGNKQVPIYADSAAPEHIEEIRSRTQLNIVAAYKGPNSVYEGIMFHKSVAHSIRVTQSSVNINREYRTYCWQKDPHAHGENKYLEKPVKWADHAMDGIRYALHTHKSVKRGGTAVGRLTGRDVRPGRNLR